MSLQNIKGVLNHIVKTYFFKNKIFKSNFRFKIKLKSITEEPLLSSPQFA